MGSGLDIISLRGLSAVGRHGVYDFERSGSQVFTADLTLHVDAHRAAQTDEVEYTVDYSTIADAAVEILTGPPVYLLETLANRLAQMALENPLVQKVEATVHKPMAPVAHLFNDVSVTLVRTRKDAPADGEFAVSPAVSSDLPRRVDAAQAEAVEVEAKGGSTRLTLSLGSNLGDSRRILSGAVSALIEAPGIEVDNVSPLVLTEPVLSAGQAAQPDYCNAVVLARTVLNAKEVLELTQNIETQYGRVRGEPWSARTLDIDLVDFGGAVISEPDLQLPHPRAASRAFVLYPWSLIEPSREFAGEMLVELADKADDRAGILSVEEDWLQEDAGETAPLELPEEEPSETVSAPDVAVEGQETTIRGNRISLWDVEGDSIFQTLLGEELAAARPIPAEVEEPAAEPKPEPKRMSEPPRRRRASSAPLPQSSLPSRRSGDIREEESAQEEVPETFGEPSLPSWRFGQSRGNVRIVDSVEPTEETAEPERSSSRHVRRKVVRPTPTGMISVNRPRSGGKKPEA